MAQSKELEKKSDMFRLDGKIAVVTGGAGLIGKALVEGFASQGAHVIVADSQLKLAAGVADELQKVRLKAEAVEIDIASTNNIKTFINVILKKHGQIDIWINCAYPRTADWGEPVENIKEASWDLNIKNHLGGYFFCTQQIARQMKIQGSGCIINLGSIYGVLAPDFSLYEGTEMTTPAPYVAIKAALLQLTQYFAAYYGEFGVRVNAISPGGVFNEQPESFVRRYIAKTALKRMAKAEDIVGAAIYLASNEASYVTGQNLIVDGGFVLGS